MQPGYPEQFSEIDAWAAQAGVLKREARIRFVQYVILASIASNRHFAQGLVFKGGNALDLVWIPNRSTRDLDFSIDHEIIGTVNEAFIRSALIPAFLTADARSGVLLEINAINFKPPGEGRTRQTIDIRIGYALADEPRLRERMQRGITSSQVIPVEMTTNEVICATTTFALGLTGPSLRISTIEDIVAEKLRALAQQVIRNRNRPQDLLDIAVICGRFPNLDRAQIATYLGEKSVNRDVVVRRVTFADERIWERAHVGYDAQATAARSAFIPFDEAVHVVRALVDSLDIPE